MNDEKKPSLSYRDAGVDIDAAEEALRNSKEYVIRTFDDNVLRDIGTFGAMYRFDPQGMEEPVIVSSVDGVGTKLKLAFMTGRHDTVGIDLVCHCVNDILVQGARPMFFMDYLAFGKIEPKVTTEVIKGLAAGCRLSGCALIGGETAEMPGMYVEGEYDVAGTIVGVVDRKKIIDGSTMQPGDSVIGLWSSGLHTNGYSLARKIVFDVAGLTCEDAVPGTGKSVADALLEPHRSYAKQMQVVMQIVNVKGMVHVTGGGITDNLPRVLPKGLGAEINLDTWQAPALFGYLAKTGQVAQADMMRTFNQGMGFLVIVSKEQEEKALDALSQVCEEPVVIGRIVEGDGKVNYTGSMTYAEQD